MTVANDARWRDAVERLQTILYDTWPQHPDGPLDPEADLRDAGVTSAETIRLLARIEEAFDMEWDDTDLPPGALSTLGAIARVVTGLRDGQGGAA